MSWSNIHKVCILHSCEQEARKNTYDALKPFLHEVNRLTSLGSTPLHFACLGSNVNLVSILHQSGATIESNFQGETPLHWACQDGSILLVKKLLRYVSSHTIHQKDENGFTAIDWARQAERPEIETLINQAIARKLRKSKMLN